MSTATTGIVVCRLSVSPLPTTVSLCHFRGESSGIIHVYPRNTIPLRRGTLIRISFLQFTFFLGVSMCVGVRLINLTDASPDFTLL